MVSMNEAIQSIKAAGERKVRVVPMPDQSVQSGLYQIEILAEGAWAPLVNNLPHSTANDLVRNALNRVILG